MRMRNLHTETPRFPDQRYSDQGKSGPKAQPKGGVDGEMVNIPLPVTVYQRRDGVVTHTPADGIAGLMAKVDDVVKSWSC